MKVPRLIHAPALLPFFPPSFINPSVNIYGRPTMCWVPGRGGGWWPQPGFASSQTWSALRSGSPLGQMLCLQHGKFHSKLFWRDFVPTGCWSPAPTFALGGRTASQNHRLIKSLTSSHIPDYGRLQTRDPLRHRACVGSPSALTLAFTTGLISAAGRKAGASGLVCSEHALGTQRHAGRA